MSDPERWDMIDRALAHTTGDPRVDALMRASLRASLESDEASRRHLRDLELRNDAELDVHLLGEAEERHISRSDLLGRFLRESSEAVKQIAKDAGALRRHSVNLWAQAPSPGSMRVVLRTLEPVPLAGQIRSQQLPDAYVRTLDANALLTLVALMNQSEESGGESPLVASLQRFKAPARNSVAKFAKVVDDANWQLVGHADVRGRDPIPLRFGIQAARRLYETAKIESSETEPQTLTGHIDAWSWSRSTMVFEPEGGRPFEASVAADQADIVGELHSNRDNRVTGDFLVTTAYPQGSPFARGRSYGLVLIKPNPGATQEPLV